jgi:Tfp pilus assembly protein PilW
MKTSRMRGVTLVELLVAMVLGLFLVGVMGMIFLGSKSTFQAQNQVSRLQESARFAIDTISADLRMSGFSTISPPASGPRTTAARPGPRRWTRPSPARPWSRRRPPARWAMC